MKIYLWFQNTNNVICCFTDGETSTPVAREKPFISSESLINIEIKVVFAWKFSFSSGLELSPIDCIFNDFQIGW